MDRHRGRKVLVGAMLSSDGTDQSVILNRLIRGTRDGGTLLIPPGSYRLDQRISVTERFNLTIEGEDADDPPTFYTDLVGQDVGQTNPNGTSARTHWVLSKCDGVTFRHINIVGPNGYRDSDGYTRLNGQYASEHGIAVSGSRNVTIECVSIDSVYGDGVYLNRGSNNISVADVGVTSCGRHGVGMVHCSDVTVDQFTLTKGGTTGFDLEPNAVGQVVDTVTISNFDIDARTVPITAVSATYEVSNITINAGVVRNGFTSWPTVIVDRGDGGRQSNWSVRRVRRTYGGLPHYGMIFANVDGVTVDGCDHSALTDRRNMAGVRFVDCSGPLVVTGNTWGACQENCESAIHVTSSGNTWDSGASTD